VKLKFGANIATIPNPFSGSLRSPPIPYPIPLPRLASLVAQGGGKLGIYDRIERVLGSHGPALFSKLVNCVDVRKCDSMDLTNIIYALGLVGYLEEDFFQAATDEVEKRMRRGECFDAIQINNLLWGLSTTGSEVEMGGVIDWVNENFDNINWTPTELSSILWSLFVKNVGAQNESLVKKAWSTCVGDRKSGGR
jgi:hypothetical protein